MTAMDINTWQDVQGEILDRINSRRWKPGDLLPKETELAQEFGCARTTINRAMQSLADTGLLERRRKAGTRVAIHPVRKATISIPIIQQEIEQKGLVYSYSLTSHVFATPPPDIQARLALPSQEDVLHIKALHLADGRPYVFEDRWINAQAAPDAMNVDFTMQSPNKWLVENAPYTKGDIAFSAANAGEMESKLLSCNKGDALFVIERRTWMNEMVITTAQLIFSPRYRMHTDI